MRGVGEGSGREDWVRGVCEGKVDGTLGRGGIFYFQSIPLTD